MHVEAHEDVIVHRLRVERCGLLVPISPILDLLNLCKVCWNILCTSAIFGGSDAVLLTMSRQSSASKSVVSFVPHDL